MNGTDVNDPSRIAPVRSGPPTVLRLKAVAVATALALAVLPSASLGQSIGALDVRSRIGEPFFAAAPVSMPGGIIDPGCVRVTPNPDAPAGAAALHGVRVRVGSADTVIIETAGTVINPVVGLRLEVGCGQPVTRDFVVVAPRSGEPQTSADAAPEAAGGSASSRVSSSASRSASPDAQTASRAQPAPRPSRGPDAERSRAARAVAGTRPTQPARAAITAPARPAASAPVRSGKDTAAATKAIPPASPGATAAADPQGRIAELQARSDELAVALRETEERLVRLQKQADLLKAQLEQRLAVLAQQAAGGNAGQPAGQAADRASATFSDQATAQTADRAARHSTAQTVAVPSVQAAPHATAGAVAQPVGQVAPQPAAQPASHATAQAAEPSIVREAEPSIAAAAEPSTAQAHEPAGSAPPVAPDSGVSPAAAPTTATATPGTEAPPAASSTASAPTAPSAARSQSALDLLLDWKVAGGLGALVLGVFAFSRRRRADLDPGTAAAARVDSSHAADADALPQEQTTQELPLPPTAAPDTNEWEIAAARALEQTDEWPTPTAANVAPAPALTGASLASVPGAGMTREFHITQQFQPSAERVVALSSPEEIVQQARTHYMEDNDVFKAIDLLELAISARSDSVRPWQALFAIYRRENMAERYQRLALAYRNTFGEDASWPAIRTLGRQMAPDLLDGADADDGSIGDDLIERWLGVPLDFTAHLLANELHAQLMDTYSGGKRRKRRTDR